MLQRDFNRTISPEHEASGVLRGNECIVYVMALSHVRMSLERPCGVQCLWPSATRMSDGDLQLLHYRGEHCGMEVSGPRWLPLYMGAGSRYALIAAALPST